MANETQDNKTGQWTLVDVNDDLKETISLQAKKANLPLGQYIEKVLSQAMEQEALDKKVDELSKIGDLAQELESLDKRLASIEKHATN